MSKTADQRLTDLEIHFAHQAKLVQDLNGIVADQNQQLLRQDRTIQRLAQEIRALKQRPVAGETPSLEDEKPPHY